MENASYPRPQLRRKNWTTLNGPWQFCFDNQKTFTEPRDVQEWPLTILVPYAPESKASGIGDTGYHDRCWYQRNFVVNEKVGRLLLHFGAVDYACKVWIDDTFVVEHEGGFTPFTADITHLVTANKSHKITVCAEDDPHDLAKPRGKQDWQLEPHSIWYPRTTGIWQSVWLEHVPPSYIEDVRWTPQFECWQIGFETWIAGNVQPGLRIEVTLTSKGEVLVNDSYEVISSEVHRKLALSDPGIDDYRNELLWSPERPTLIDAKIRLVLNGQIIDEVDSYTAMRTVGVQRDRFMLNGHPFKLRLVLDQGYWPDTLMTPPSEEALRLDIELTKKMGFNGVRKHQKIEDPRFLYLCDRLGLLVWEEMPSAYRFTIDAMERLTKEWVRVIQRDSSHPCVVVWVPINESWGVPNLTESNEQKNLVMSLYHLTKAIDPTRPVIGNDGWESTSTDIIGIHDYDTSPKSLQLRYGPDVKLSELFDRRRPGGRVLTLDGFPHKGQPVMLTEFGGIACTKRDDPYASKSWGYANTQTATELRDRYTELLEAIHQIEIFSGFCYTQLTDTFQEANGLLYADRTPKFPIEQIRAATTGRRFSI